MISESENTMDIPTEEAIRSRAHELWDRAGKPDGQGDHFWFEAERQLREEGLRDAQTKDRIHALAAETRSAAARPVSGRRANVQRAERAIILMAFACVAVSIGWLASAILSRRNARRPGQSQIRRL
jgi:hypothetical protein